MEEAGSQETLAVDEVVDGGGLNRRWESTVVWYDGEVELIRCHVLYLGTGGQSSVMTPRFLVTATEW